jgi:lysophospholipase L1-like esterase
MGLVRRLFRRSFAQVESYALEWERANAAALTADGPLWVVLGDSAAQAVGASAHDLGWVGLVHEQLGPAWRVVNLSRSGARTREVVDVQWPRGRELAPDLVTAVVGGNDAVHTSLSAWLRDAGDLLVALPPGAVVSTVARGVRERKTRQVNAVIRQRAAQRGLRVADLWGRTGPPYKGLYADGFHPNDAGYRQWADAVTEALSLPVIHADIEVEDEPPST